MAQYVLLLALVPIPLLVILATLNLPQSHLLHSNSIRLSHGVATSLVLTLIGSALHAIEKSAFLTGILTLPPLPEFASVHVTPLGMTMLGLVSAIALTVVRFSENSLTGNPFQERFLIRLAFTVICTQLLVLTEDLISFTVAWLATSVALNSLLTVFPDRDRAMQCARTKWIFSRSGDIALVAAILIVILQGWSTSFSRLTLVATHQLSLELGRLGFTLEAVALLIAIATVTKSAQVPFHTWLPASLDVPAPVSALMHAGIVNAGALLLLKLSPLFEHALLANNLLVLVGTITAIFGVSCMTTQSSVKRSLAYSTVGQMGFLVMQIGLGLYSLALIHMVAHAIYKSYSFLASGESGIVKSTASTAKLNLGASVIASCMAIVLTFLLLKYSEQLFHISVNHTPLLAALAATIGYSFTLMYAQGRRSTLYLGYGLSILISMIALRYGLHSVVEVAYGITPAVAVNVSTSLCLGASMMFLMLFLVQIFQFTRGSEEFGRALFVHLHNGFYLGELTSRLLNYLFGETRQHSYHNKGDVWTRYRHIH